MLRFVVESSNDRIPVEMRGNKVKGVLEVGNEVVIKGRGRRDRDGVIRPREIMNKTTNSLVSVRRKNLLVRFVGFSFSVAVSVVSGVISAIIAGRFATRTMPVSYPGPGAPSSRESLLPIVIGAVAGLLVFYFVYLRPRRR